MRHSRTSIVPQDSPKASTLKAFLQYAIGRRARHSVPTSGIRSCPSSIVTSDQALIAKIGS